MLGGFNIFNRGDATLEAITNAGFVAPGELQSVPGSNVARDKHYDLIATTGRCPGSLGRRLAAPDAGSVRRRCGRPKIAGGCERAVRRCRSGYSV